MSYTSHSCHSDHNTWFISSSDDELKIYIKNKCKSHVDPRNVLILIHGATWPLDSVYDLELGGKSMMDYMSNHYNVFAFDSRGYGMSDKPKREPNSGPVMTGEETYNDLKDVIAFINSKVEDACINLYAWSGGCVPAFFYAIREPDGINTLICYGMRWLSTEADGVIPEYMSVDPYFEYVYEHQAKRIYKGYPEGKADEWMPEENFKAWEESVKKSPQTHVPTGAQHDARIFWFQGKKMFEPSQVKCPTLIMAGEFDHATPFRMSEGVFDELSNKKQSKLVKIKDATHYAMMETNREMLYKEVKLFLDKYKGNAA